MSPIRIDPLPALIVGTGPVGLFQAVALSRLNVPVVIIGRHATRLGAPKAHALSPRSLEICRQFGVSVSAIRSFPAPRDEAQWVRFMTNLSGAEVGCLPYERMSLDVLEHTPEMLHNIAQPDFESMLMDLLEDDANVVVRKGWTWVSSDEIDNDPFGPHVLTVIRNTYTGEEQTVRSAFVIGCDGANSRIRDSLAITVDAEDTTETMMTIHFSCNLRPVVKEKVGMLYWIMDPAARGFIIAYDLGGNQPKYHPLESFTQEKCQGIIRAAIGQDIPMTFHSSLPWLLRRQVANQYFRGRIILAGDAAHSFPPTGGLGLNSGIADAHNLAYKIAGIYRDHADPPTVFTAYQDERRPVAVRNSNQSVTNGKKIFALLKALNNTDPEVDVARQGLHEALAQPERRALIDRLIAEQTEHFDNLMLHIGYVYSPHWNPKNATDFHPSYEVGARLPHVWIDFLNAACKNSLPPPVDLSYLKNEAGAAKREKWRYSSLDLVECDKFLFLCASDSKWASSCERLQCRLLHNVYVLNRDFCLVGPHEKAQRAWIEGLGLDKGNLIVVRPDQHMAIKANEHETIETVCRELERSMGH